MRRRRPARAMHAVLQGTGGGPTNGEFASVAGHPLWQTAIDAVHAAWKVRRPNQLHNLLAGAYMGGGRGRRVRVTLLSTDKGCMPWPGRGAWHTRRSQRRQRAGAATAPLAPAGTLRVTPR